MNDSLRMELPMSAVEQVPLGITRVDLDGNLRFANGQMLRIAGLDTWKGKTLRDVFVGEDLAKVLEGLKRREQREGEAYEVGLTRADNKRRIPISVTAFPETDANDTVIGTLGFVRDLSLERAAGAMVKLIQDTSGTSALLDAISEALKPLVPFAQLQVFRLNEAGTHLRTIYPQAAVAGRSYRWWRIPDVMGNLLHDHETLTINDLAAWYRVQLDKGMDRDGAIEQFLKEGYTATMSLPVFQDSKQVAGIVLCRKAGATFTAEERETAEKLPLTEAVGVAQRNDTQGNLHFLLALMRDITAAYDSVQNVAQTVVERIAAHYGWDYVSIHQVDKPAGVVRLIAQKPARPDLHSYRDEIPIGEGIVGYVHRNRTAVLTGNVEKDPKFAAIFVRHRQTPTCSELCVPIGKGADWLLNVEDAKVEAFCPEDQAGLKTIADSLDALLRRTLEYNYRSAIVRNASDAILLVDDGHVVFEANDAAGSLLQLPKDAIKGRPVTDFLDDQEHAAVLLAGDSFANHGTFMRRTTPEGTTPVQVLLSVARLPRETPGRVFIASDLSQFVRSDELELARELFREITGQVKTPMSLAISWLRRLARQAESGAGDVPDKVLQQLQKAEVTLDRMLLIERGGQAGSHHPVLLPIDDFVRRALDDLPERERATVGRSFDAPGAWVRADAFELRYCVQTVLTYLLRLAANARGIELRTRAQDGLVKLEIRGRADAMSAPQIDVQCRAGQAVAELSLGRRTLAELAQRNGGQYEDYRQGETTTFAFLFPSVPPGDAP